MLTLYSRTSYKNVRAGDVANQTTKIYKVLSLPTSQLDMKASKA